MHENIKYILIVFSAYYISINVIIINYSLKY